ncbi:MULTISPECIES: energy-coupling factor transporter transmembrane component T family protein [Mycobacterium]|jgi:energy-coupling factor transport system permease protein|uniref:Cobalt transport family protein n=5 Tax=Mycobacterium avium complex (MAC) TaxID=120793 RepID=X8CS44_MYCIT|nr:MULTISPECIES: energy-coupling factor transporter transmembrane protein EcfT [Mycobacterium]EUA58849.1 cobalt transport family protein [Mycobacterium intracellulare 1956]AFC43275.1 cobalt transport protein [Mycobacterium intracellulare ATCC 13950]AFC53436.1 cobalt transport protein [Mycobacterium paraintracellulare]AFS13979.1 Cobalt transport protein [Mycobacterium intracellulare subsp. intracellulare MTCC 9506]AGP63364.1 cobalt transport protein [Mycobacterium intracellulare subsp. yongonen
MTAPADAKSAKGKTRRTPRPVVLLVPVPGTSKIHELWAGTKLLVVLGVSILLTFYPGWASVGLMLVLLITAARLAHIPRGALPSPRRWIWIVLAVGGITAALGAGSPVVSIAGVHIGLGGTLHFVRVTALSIVLIGLGAMLSWTTNVAEMGPALAALGRPLRWLRIPSDEWAVALALALRAFPMLIEEFQVLYAARRLRPNETPRSRRARRRQQARDMIDLLTAAIVVTLRRADEMGDAITARGGIGQLSAAPGRPKLADWVTLAITAAAGAAGVVVDSILQLH